MSTVERYTPSSFSVLISNLKSNFLTSTADRSELATAFSSSVLGDPPQRSSSAIDDRHSESLDMEQEL